MKLTELGEFGLIDIIKELFAGIDAGGAEGIGDDCAVIPFDENNSLVVTTDMLVEDVHFLRNSITPYELGRKSLAVNLSDVAAMGAAPCASFLSVALPAGTELKWAEEFLRGYKELSEEFRVSLLGGDTTASTGGITINVTALGKAETANIKRRSAAKEGDVIFVTGFMGDSAQGLFDIRNGNARSDFARIHNNPKPYVREGIWLGTRPEVHAMIDVSDGIASDLRHIAEASSSRVEIFIEKIPRNCSIELAVTGGEDYVLLFTADAVLAPRLAQDYEVEFGTPLYEIGRITKNGTAIKWLDNGKPVDMKWKGFEHF